MSTSFDEPTKLCVAPPGEDAASDPNAFRPNVISPHAPLRMNGPVAAPAEDNFAVEAWFLYTTTVTPDTFTYVGLVDTGQPNVLIGGISVQNPTTIRGQYQDPVGGLFQTAGVSGLVGQWFHVAVNFNRTGNMEIFINTVSSATVAILANALGGTERFGVYGSSQVKSDYESAGAELVVLVGPVALHYPGLLTAAQITDSYWNRTVQDLGSSLTRVRYDWTVERHTGWDFDRTRWLNLHDDATIGHVAAPATGANGTPRVRDLSGTNRHWTFGSLASYTTATANKAELIFAVDPFFT